ncbi:hypothetical protein IJ098_02465 [Candidatus Saccharibacteria bacterium]|nr:hypothetical protein [Candidatus Saccharibacteria bacterium]
MKYGVEFSNKGTTYSFASTANRPSRATLDLFSGSVDHAYLTYNGDKWNNKETKEEVLLKLDKGEYGVCPRFTIAKRSPKGEDVPTLIFRVKHPSGGKVRLYINLKENKSISFNFSEKLTTEEMDGESQFLVHSVDILKMNNICFVSEISKVPTEENDTF